MNQVWRILAVALMLLAMALPAAVSVQAAPRAGTTAAPQACTTISRSVSASSDDAEEQRTTAASNPIGFMYLDSSDLELVDDNGDRELQYIGIRFTNLTIPPGAVIQNAYISFRAKASDSATTNLTFYGQAADNAGAFTTTAYDISSRTRTTSSAVWNSVPSWSAGSNYQTPELAALVQEITNRVGWASGNAIVFIVDGSGERTAYAWDDTTNPEPGLTVTYCQSADVGDFVWADADADGIQDVGEAGANNVTVTLWNAGANGQVGGGDDALVGTTQTLAGSYGFSGLTSGATYYLAFSKPAGNSFSPQNVGADSTDSDVNPSTGLTAPFVWTAATQDIDAGLHSGPQCFAISDSTDTLKNEQAVDSLIQFDILSGTGAYIGPATNGTYGNAVNLESATWNPFDGKLYSVEDLNGSNDAYLVTLNTTTGAYARVGGPLGTCSLRLRNGSSGGNITASDVDGLGIDFTTGKMYATIRRTGPDALFQINPATGVIVPNAFTGGWGCVEVEYPSGNTGLTDIDDIGFNPAGVLYGAANQGQTETRIVRIDEANGDTNDLGAVLFGGVALTDIEGFSYDATGRAMVSTGQDGDDGNDDAAYELNLTQSPIVATRRVGYFGGAGALINAPPTVSYEDYEGLTCYGVPLTNMELSSIGNYIWVDENNDGHQDAGEDVIPNVDVQLWIPGNDGVFGTADDELLATTVTDAQGQYLFDDLLAGPYETRIPASNFSAGSALEGMVQSTNPVNGGADLGNQSLPYQIMLPFSTDDVTADFGYRLAAATDLGDLPASYNNNLLSENGARHVIGSLTLGAQVTADANGQPSATATGDSLDDGVVKAPGESWKPGTTVHLNITTSGGSGRLGGWFDWNNDGDFDDTDEFVDLGAVSGAQQVSVPIPSGPQFTALNTRFRLFNPAGIPGGSLDANDSVGAAINGEVEDYQWAFLPNAVNLGDLRATAMSTGERLTELLRSWLQR